MPSTRREPSVAGKVMLFCVSKSALLVPLVVVDHEVALLAVGADELETLLLSENGAANTSRCELSGAVELVRRRVVLPVVVDAVRRLVLHTPPGRRR